MPDQDTELKSLYASYGADIDRMKQDVQNTYSSSKISFIYGRLKKLGPFKIADLSMDLIFEIDMMQGALVVEYAKIFSDGPRKVNRDRVPAHLKIVHDTIMEIRRKRYAHNDYHPSIENRVELDIEDTRIVVNSGSCLQITFGAPKEWEELIKWLEKHLFEQTEKQLKRLTSLTGREWVQPMD